SAEFQVIELGRIGNLKVDFVFAEADLGDVASIDLQAFRRPHEVPKLLAGTPLLTAYSRDHQDWPNPVVMYERCFELTRVLVARIALSAQRQVSITRYQGLRSNVR